MSKNELTFGKKWSLFEKWVYLEKRVTLYKMGHLVGEMGHIKKWVTL